MSNTRFRFVVTQKSAYAWGVLLFVLIFVGILTAMVAFLMNFEVGEVLEWIVILISIFGTYALITPLLLKMYRGPATLILRKDRLSIKLDRPVLLLSFREKEVSFDKIDSYEVVNEGFPAFLVTLKGQDKGFVLHRLDGFGLRFDESVNQIIAAIKNHQGK